MATVKKVKKAQGGTAQYKSQWGKKTADSTKYYNDKAMDNLKAVLNLRSHGASAKDTEGYQKEQRQALKDRNRQRMKGTPGYDKNGFPVTKQKTGGKVKKAQVGMTMKQLKMKYPTADTTARGDVRGSEMNSGAPKKILKKYNDTYNAFEKKFGNKPAKDKKGGVIKKAQMGSKMQSDTSKRPSISPEMLDKMRKASESKAGKGSGRLEKLPYKPAKDAGKFEKLPYRSGKDTGNMEFYKKGGVVKSKMKMGGKMSKMSKMSKKK
jgi:hypothetical protein